jgi:dihydrofolate reductase
MRSVTYSMGVSLDGYIAGPDGGFDWTAPGEEVFRFWIDEIREVGVHLLGRKLYETMLYWETADQDPSLADSELEWAALWKPLPKVVFSTTLPAVQGNADLADITADIPSGSAAAERAAEPAGTPARTLAKAVRRSGICMLIAFALVGVVALIGEEAWIPLAFFPGVAAVIAASGFLGYGVADAWQERRSRKQLPPRPRWDGRGLEGGRPGSTGRDLAPPGTRTDQTRVELRTHRPGRRYPSGQGSRAPRRVRPIPGAV